MNKDLALGIAICAAGITTMVVFAIKGKKAIKKFNDHIAVINSKLTGNIVELSKDQYTVETL